MREQLPGPHVIVLIAEPLCLAEPYAIDNGGMVQLIGDNGIVRPQEGFNTGRGTPEFCGVRDRVDIITGTFGKALGGASGGFTAARPFRP